MDALALHLECLLKIHIPYIIVCQYIKIRRRVIYIFVHTVGTGILQCFMNLMNISLSFAEQICKTIDKRKKKCIFKEMELSYSKIESFFYPEREAMLER